MHARTVGWLGQRFSLLDRWNLRYSASASEVAWPVAGAFSGAQELAANSAIPLMTPGSVNSGPAASGTEPDSGPQQFRVRRQMERPQPGELPSNIETKDAAGSSFSLQSIESPRQAIPNNTIQRKADTAIAQAIRTAPAVLASSPMRTSEIYPSQGQRSVPLPLQLSSITTGGEFSGVGTEGAMIGDNSQPNQSLEPPLSNGRSGIEGPAANVVRETKTADYSHVVVSSASPVSTRQKTAVVQRKAIADSRVRETPRQGPSTIAGAMIWCSAGPAQRNAPASRPLLSGGPPTIQRFADAPGSSSSSSSALDSDTPATAKRKSGINMVQMAEDVGRLLARQLVIERERRGRSL